MNNPHNPATVATDYLMAMRLRDLADETGEPRHLDAACDYDDPLYAGADVDILQTVAI